MFTDLRKSINCESVLSERALCTVVHRAVLYARHGFEFEQPSQGAAKSAQHGKSDGARATTGVADLSALNRQEPDPLRCFSEGSVSGNPPATLSVTPKIAWDQARK